MQHGSGCVCPRCSGKGWLASGLIAVGIIAVAVWTIGEIKGLRFIGSNPNTPHTITVYGQGKTFVSPDVATVQVTVSSEAGPNDLAATQDRNTKTTNAVIAYVKSQGVKDSDVKTTNYSITPRYNYSDRGQQFLGYTVRQDIQVKMRDLAKVGAILNGVVQNGANEVNALQFTVDDPKKPREDARNQAIADAKGQADRLAKELGVKIVRLANYSESGGVPPPIFYGKGEAYGMGGGGSGPVPVEPGQNEIQSNVTITYEVE